MLARAPSPSPPPPASPVGIPPSCSVKVASTKDRVVALLASLAALEADGSTCDVITARNHLQNITKVFNDDLSAALGAPVFWTRGTRDVLPATSLLRAVNKLLRAIPHEDDDWRAAASVLQVLAQDCKWREEIILSVPALVGTLARGISTDGGHGAEPILCALYALTAGAWAPESIQVAAAPLVNRLSKFIASCDEAPPTVAIAVFANLCKYKSVRVSLKRAPHLNRLLRRLIEMLELDNIPAVVHSLRILMQLVGTNSAVQALFSETNVLEAQKIMMAVLENPDSEPDARAAAIDLLRIMLSEEVFAKTFSAEVVAFETPMKAMAVKPELARQLFRLGAILLKHGGSSSPKFVRPLIKLQLAQKAMDTLLAPVGRHDKTSIAYDERVRDACDVIQALLDALLDDAVDQHYFDVIAEALIPTIPNFLNCIVDSLSTEARQPMLELALAFLRYKSFELDDRDLEGTDVQKMRTVAMQWASETSVGDQIGVLMAALYGTVAEILSGGRQQVAPLPPRADDGPRLARIMARSASPYVIHACIALLTQTPPDTWTLFGVSMCKASEELRFYEDEEDDDDPPYVSKEIAAPSADDMAASPMPALLPEPPGGDPEVPVEQPPEVCQCTPSDAEPPSTMIPATPPSAEANPPAEVAPSSLNVPSQTGLMGHARAKILTEMRRTADLVDEQMAGFEQTIDSLQRTIKENEHHLTQSACALLTAENQLSEKKDIIAELQESLKQTTRELATTRDELAGTTNQIAQLEAEVAAAGRANRTKESASRKEIARLSAQVGELQELQATLAQTTTTQKGTIAALRDQLRAANIEQEERERAHDELLAHLSSALNATKKKTTRRGTTTTATTSTKGIVAIGGEPQILEDQED
ncbi:hypothetical protein HDU87_000708 [Geranomyces variabilis]|uniref:Uncharacterized protein n=1 Tax=Geranomyces variabilis TaxID=109894 RepID=A0AAD5TN38_9FUNG|nr:hypothetical protein HDU87_000708 [Geranomyces variabilis]